MKRLNFKLMAVLAMFALTAVSAQAQVTPQAVIGNAPSLPTAEQWAANGGQHTETFKTKIAELNGKLNEMQVAMVPNATLDEMMKAQPHPQATLPSTGCRECPMPPPLSPHSISALQQANRKSIYKHFKI
jgi:TolA-binding protein